MTARLIHRSSALVAGLIVVAAFALVPGVARASGGGGCGQAVTDGTGTKVEIASFCFGPTIARVHPGAAVTFTNLDPVSHSVLGANGSWGGYDALKKNRSVTYRFSEAGVYPYVCTFHIGMVGVVVVGDGIGGAISETTKEGPVTKVVGLGSSPAANVIAVTPVAAPADGSSWPVAALAAFALLVIAAGTVVVARRRRRSVA
jgi:plastocyanin